MFLKVRLYYMSWLPEFFFRGKCNNINKLTKTEHHGYHNVRGYSCVFINPHNNLASISSTLWNKKYGLESITCSSHTVSHQQHWDSHPVTLIPKPVLVLCPCMSQRIAYMYCMQHSFWHTSYLLRDCLIKQYRCTCIKSQYYIFYCYSFIKTNASGHTSHRQVLRKYLFRIVTKQVELPI